jgi:hypothetical protein
MTMALLSERQLIFYKDCWVVQAENCKQYYVVREKKRKTKLLSVK